MTLVREIITHYNYLITIFLMVAGLYVVIARGNMIKKLVGLSLFQTSVYLLYIAPGKIIGGTAPIVNPAFKVYSNPLPHVLILTAMAFTPVRYIAPAREISIVIGAFFGVQLLKEADAPRRLLAAGGMVAGIIALALG